MRSSAHARRRMALLRPVYLAAACAVLSVARVSAWGVPVALNSVRSQLLPRPVLTPVVAAAASPLGVGRRRGRSLGVARMSEGGESEVPKKGSTGGRSVVLGPGLFDPNIQVGPGAEDEEEEILLARSQFKALAARCDADDDGKLDRDGLMVLAKELGHKWTMEQAIQTVWKIDSDADGLMSIDDLFNWYKEGNLSQVTKQPVSEEVMDVVKNVASLSKEDASNLFQLQDNDASLHLDQKELNELLHSAGFEVPDAKVGEIHRKIAGEEGVSMAGFYAWLSSGFDLQGVKRKFSEIIVNKSEDDKRRVFVRGFPWKAKADAVQRYFGKRSGEVEDVTMINWSRDGTPSGRSIVTFKEAESVEGAMKLHRNKMGSRWLEVYRVNEGDREEAHKVAKSLHGALDLIRSISSHLISSHLISSHLI